MVKEEEIMTEAGGGGGGRSNAWCSRGGGHGRLLPLPVAVHLLLPLLRRRLHHHHHQQRQYPCCVSYLQPPPAAPYHHVLSFGGRAEQQYHGGDVFGFQYYYCGGGGAAGAPAVPVAVPQKSSPTTDCSSSISSMSSSPTATAVSAISTSKPQPAKTDTASVLHEALGYIRFLHDQVQFLSSPYLQRLPPSSSAPHAAPEPPPAMSDLRSRGLCLVPVACTDHVAGGNGNSADVWSSVAAMGLSTTAAEEEEYTVAARMLA